MPVTVLVDTNVWVSALLNPRGLPARLCREWLSGRFGVVVSSGLLLELVDVLARPRIVTKYGLLPAEVQRFVRLLAQGATHVVVRGEVHECRDPDDDLVLETAILGKVRCIVTRDDDIKRDEALLESLRARGIEVLSVQGFLKLLDAGEV